MAIAKEMSNFLKYMETEDNIKVFRFLRTFMFESNMKSCKTFLRRDTLLDMKK